MWSLFSNVFFHFRLLLNQPLLHAGMLMILVLTGLKMKSEIKSIHVFNRKCALHPSSDLSEILT